MRRPSVRGVEPVLVTVEDAQRTTSCFPVRDVVDYRSKQTLVDSRPALTQRMVPMCRVQCRHRSATGSQQRWIVFVGMSMARYMLNHPGSCRRRRRHDPLVAPRLGVVAGEAAC